MMCLGRLWCSRWRLTAAALVLWLGVGLPAGRGQNAEPIVSEVTVIGCKRIPEARVLNEIKTRKDQPYRPHVIREDVRNLDAKQWYHSVAAEEQQTPEGVRVVFRVLERGLVQEVIYEGAKHIDRDELEKLTGLKRGSPMSVASNQKAAQAIEEHYHEKGRLFASVELIEGGKDDDARVVFRVTEGPIVRVRDIRFEGNTFAVGARLKTQINSGERLLGLGGKYNPLMLDEDVNKLIEYYRTFGYFDVKIRRKLEWNPGHETVDVVFVIDEGIRYLTKEVKVAGATKVDTELLLVKNSLSEGKTFSGRDMKASAKKMEFEYGRKGFINTHVRPELNYSEEPGAVSVVYQVDEGRPARVGEIRIVGNSTTRDNVILRQIPVGPGQILSTPDLQLGERNLARLQLFRADPQSGIAPTISILDPESDTEYKDLLVQVEEDRTGSLLFGVGVNSDAGASASIVLHERNFDLFRPPTSMEDIWSNRAFRGAGQEFRVEAVPGTELSRYTVSFREPYLLDSCYSLSTSGYYYTRRYDDYDERRFGGRVSVGRRLSPAFPHWTASVGVRVEDVKVDNFVNFAPVDFHEVAGHNSVYAPKVALTRDTRDSFLRPSEGNLFEVSYEHAFGDFTYPIFSIEDAQYWTLYERPDGSGRHVLSVRGQMGISDDAPLYDRFYAGGFRTFRGFDFRGVGPDKNGFKVGGDFMLLGSVEYQFPLFANDYIYGVVFSDFGTVEDNIGINDFRLSAGAGLRLVVPMLGPVPIALDWGYPILRERTDGRQIFSFWLGFSR